MASLEIRVTGDDAMRRRIEAIADRFGDRLAAALYRRMELVATVAKRDYVPVDLGTLRDDIVVFPPQRQGTEISVTIAAGTGASASYAAAVHEHPSAFDPPSWRGKTITFSPPGHGPKFIERPLLAAVATLDRDLAADLSLERL